MLKFSPFNRLFNRLSLPFIAILAVFVVLIPAHASSASHRASAEEMLNLAHMPQQLKGMADQVLNPIRARFSQIKTTEERAVVVREHLRRLEELIYQAYSWDVNREQMIKLYTQTYTEEELKDLVAFFKSPSGQKYLNPGPGFAQGFAQLNRSKAESLRPGIQQIQTDLQKALANMQEPAEDPS